MNFLTMIKSGVSVKNTASEFVKVLLKKSWDKNELCLDVACNFVNDILRAIGLDCVITPEQIVADWSYVWPVEQMQIYSFHYIEADFKKFEEFLCQLCALVNIQNEIFDNNFKELDDIELESPVEYLMQLIAVWCSVYKELVKIEDLQTNKRFEEPLARINFHLLKGMHEVRKMYCLDLTLLDAICTRLYWSALKGLYYKQTHDMIFSGLLEMFSKSYDLFYKSSPRNMEFFYEAFAIQINCLTPLKLYQAFQNMLLEEVAPDKLNILLNFLIEPYMLKVYFTTFLAKKYNWYKKCTARITEKIQQEALKFLHILQGKLLSLDCFSREFVEGILFMAVKSNEVNSSLACALYITMMKRKFSDDMILKHMMDFYVAHVGSITYLKRYIQSMFSSFGFLLHFDSLLEIITDHRTTDIIRILSAHILVIVFEFKFQKKDSSNRHQLQHLLHILPEIFENLHCQQTEGVLLKVYFYVPFEKLKKPILDNFIHYAVGIFTYPENNLEYPLIMNIFVIFYKCLNCNKEWRHLELISDHILIKYCDMIKNLKHIEENGEKSLSQDFLELYNSLIKRFNVMLKSKYFLFDNSYLEIIRNLSKYFLYNAEIKSLIFISKSLIDVYAMEIVISCILKLIKLESDNNENYTFFPEALELFKYLWSLIENMEELLKYPIVRIKTYFCCFLQLITNLPLHFETHMYVQLVKILIMVNFKNKFLNHKGANELQQLHPLQALEYQRLMLQQFTKLHKCQRVQINSNMVWKLCIYYGMFKHNFQEELKILLVTLGNYRFKIYKHIISVLIYNLYNQKPALKHTTIMFILKKHKQLLDDDIKVESSQLLKVHVVLLVLQILVKVLSIQRLTRDLNRLEALKHLYIFTEDLDLDKLKAKYLLLEQMSQMRQNLISSEEGKMLSNFEQLVDKKQVP